ncbi:hypothetical protein CCACVL1_14869 [Corchorus capsularis]|uniref:Uncharacterized protein n=1 Tax=Corchorus capsularis TaxID=210143 RepID=A0A1R3I561_COCAP|nr:hypothetical protein CCACVL1_14869 [Corchorus capsularis]
MVKPTTDSIFRVKLQTQQPQ